MEHVTDMGGFIENGTGSPEGDRWLKTMLRMCMLVEAWMEGGNRWQKVQAAPYVSMSSRDRREDVGSHMLPYFMAGLFGRTVSEINPVIRSRILAMSSGTDRAVSGGALIDFARTADRVLLTRLAGIHDTVIRRFEDEKDDGKRRLPSCDYMAFMSLRHLILPVLLCRGDWRDPKRFTSECATGYMPVTVACPSATDHGYEGPDADDSWLRMLANPESDMITYVSGYERMLGAYDPLSFAGCSLSGMYEESYGLHLYLMLMSGLFPDHGSGYGGMPPLWMIPMTARTVTTMIDRYNNAVHDPMYVMGGFLLDDIIHAVSGQLRPAETEWLLCDVDWDWRPQAKDIMSVLTGMDDAIDPASWNRISWQPLAAAIDAGDQHAAVTAIRAFMLAFTGAFPRTLVSMKGTDGTRKMALAATIPDRSSFHMIADMLQGGLPERFVRENGKASDRTTLLMLPHIEGDDTITVDKGDRTYFRIPECIRDDDHDGKECPEKLRATLEGKGAKVWSALSLAQ